MRTVTTALSGWIDPAVVFDAVFSESDPVFWLDGGIDATTGMSYMGSGTVTATVTVPGTIRIMPSETLVPMSVLDFLRSELPLDLPLPLPLPVPLPLATGLSADSAGGCPLGWVGWLGYGVGAQTLAVQSLAVQSLAAEFSTTPFSTTPFSTTPFSTAPSSASKPGPADASSTGGARHPDAAFLFCDRLVAFDHSARRVVLIAIGTEWTPELCLWRDAIFAALAEVPTESSGPRHTGPGETKRPTGSGESKSVDAPPPVTALWRKSDREYLELIARCQAAIVEGEAYQLCLTTAADVRGSFDPPAVYAALRAASPTHHGGYLCIDGVSLLSASPERFLSVSGSGAIESKPIKGTRPRGADAVEDQRLHDELRSSEKERAENLMIVDLMRNDIGRVSAVGSVRVPILMAVESYAQVHQLVSTVRGQLAAGRHPVDAVAACFPAGSMTGAPKMRATQILAELERQPRGIYAGAFGYFGVDGTIDLAMVIRSIIVDAAGATIGTGGGITASSVPGEELAEVKLKAAVLLRVLGVTTESAE